MVVQKKLYPQLRIFIVRAYFNRDFMLKILIFLIAVSVAVSSIAQITTTKVASKSDENNSPKYDSVSNFVGKNVYQYLEQELYLKGMNKDLRKYGYDGFYVDINKGKFDNGVYKCCDGYNSKYDALVGKYFKVVEIIKHPKAEENEYLYGTKFYLKLQEKASNDIVYFEYSTEYEHSFPFIVVGFFEKLKKKAIGQKFVFGSTDKRFGTDELDIKTGKPITFKLAQKWECTNVTIEEQYYNLSLLLTDNAGQTFPIGYEMAIGPKKLYDVFTEKQADIYKAKSGHHFGIQFCKGRLVSV
jgi:hypothetical protein